MNETTYPFSAIVGQQPMKLALKAVAVDPEIGGVLVRGPRGTGKSTLSRSLAELLPEQDYHEGCPLRCKPDRPADDCPFCTDGSSGDIESDRPRFVELPLGATPDQVIGSLSIDEAVNEGRKRLNPGLLARAHRGILYVDEVNLLPDRLVDLLLDVAASGVNRVEREGLSVRHPSEFLLIGTMNPEEGRLRPQLRDRFGLSVRAENQTDPERRQELARRASAFRTDPESFRSEWEDEQRKLRESLLAARERLTAVTFNEGQPEWIANRVLDSGVEGHRADVVVRRAAKALAAIRERTEVHQEDLEDAFELAVDHRRSPDPDGGGRPPEPDRDPFGEDESTNGEKNGGDESIVEPRDEVNLSLNRVDSGVTEDDRGTDLRAATGWDPGERLNLTRTLRNALNRSLRDGSDPAIRSEDLSMEVARERTPGLLLWVIDASASMARNETIGFVKSVVKNHLQRDSTTWTGLVDFRGNEGTTVVPPTRRHKTLLSVLGELPVSGETPFAEGLETARSVLSNFRGRHHGADAHTVVVSDGRVTLTDRVLQSVRELKYETELTLVDAELGTSNWGMIDQLANDAGLRPVSLRESVA